LLARLLIAITVLLALAGAVTTPPEHACVDDTCDVGLDEAVAVAVQLAPQHGQPAANGVPATRMPAASSAHDRLFRPPR
jgi:hypothetical protein